MKTPENRPDADKPTTGAAVPEPAVSKPAVTEPAEAEHAASAPAVPEPPAPRPRKGRAVVWLLIFVAGLVLGRVACAPAHAPPGSTPAASHTSDGHATSPGAASVWTCSMHPQIRMPEPGDCPLCGMDLVPAVDEDEQDGDSASSRELRLSDVAIALADIETAAVERRVVSHEVRMVGKVAFDETRMASLTARFAGRLERVFVDFTGVTVREGDHMVEIYSPTLIATQQELLQAIATAKTLAAGPLSIVSERTDAAVVAAKNRLRLWGLEPAQIADIIEHGEPLERVTVNAPMGGVVVRKHGVEGQYVETGTPLFEIADLSRVWVLLDAYESDMVWLRFGQRVEFTTESDPGAVFEGRVAFIDPVLDDHTRTVKVRVNVDNADGRLKPDMFVRARLQAKLTERGRALEPEMADLWMCPMHPEDSSTEPGKCSVCGMDRVPATELGFVSATDADLSLVIPATAPLLTGDRAVVYVRRPAAEHAEHAEHAEGRKAASTGAVFEGREVVLGPRAGDWYVVRSGLAEGERVVVHGAFKLDSEMQIRAKPSMMNPTGGAMPAGHDHGTPSQDGER